VLSFSQIYIQSISNGILAIFLFRRTGGWPVASTPNLEDQVIFDQGFLPPALDTPVSNCKPAVGILYIVQPASILYLTPRRLEM